MRIQNHYPWYCQSPEMRTNLLIMCKMLWLLLVINGIWGYFSDPFIPFIRLLDFFHSFPGVFEGVLKMAFLVGGLGLLFNFRVRTMALILGMGIFLFLLGSKPAFRNHLFICACAFILCGLTDKKQEPRLLYAQLGLVYFGAGLNKIWQLDWWNGQFMHNWLLNARENTIYKSIHDLFAPHLADHLFSLGSLGIELGIAYILLFKKRHAAVVWIIVVFHTILYTITGFRFGHFFEDIVIYLLVFLVIPEKPLVIWPRATRNSPFGILLRRMNWNRQFHFNQTPPDTSHWLCLSYAGQSYFNTQALGKLILYSPATYFGLLLADTFVRAYFNYTAEHMVTATWLWAGILFYAWLWLDSKRKVPNASFGQGTAHFK